MQMEEKRRAELRERQELERETAVGRQSDAEQAEQMMGSAAEELGDIRRMLKDVRGLVKDGEVGPSSSSFVLPPFPQLPMPSTDAYDAITASASCLALPAVRDAAPS
jgi:hypothetical protein